MRSFGESIYTRKANIVEAEEGQSNLLKNIVEFSNKSRPRTTKSKDIKTDTYESAYALYEGRELTLNAFQSGIFSIKATKGERLKMLTPTQILQRLAIVFA